MRFDLRRAPADDRLIPGPAGHAEALSRGRDRGAAVRRGHPRLHSPSSDGTAEVNRALGGTSRGPDGPGSMIGTNPGAAPSPSRTRHDEILPDHLPWAGHGRAVLHAGECRADPGRAARGPAVARVTEDDGAIRVETDTLEAVIPKKDPKDLPGVEAAATLLPDRARAAASWAGNPPLRYRQAEGATAW